MKLTTEAEGLVSEFESEGRVKRLSLRQRQGAALKTAVLGLAITLISVFIPVMHFILVPIGLGLTAYFSSKVLSLTHVFILMGLSCPKCGAEFRETSVRSPSRETRLYCFSCRTFIILQS